MVYSSTPGLDVFTLVSNLTLLFPSVLAWTLEKKRGAAMIVVSIVLFVETWFSFIYHMCKSYSVCLGGFWVWRSFDFFFATSILWLVAMLLIYFPPRLRNLEIVLYILGFIIVAVLQALSPHNSIGHAIFGGVSIAALVIYYIYHLVLRCTYGNWDHFPNYNWYYLAVGTGVLVVSAHLYLIQSYYLSSQWITHSTWHVMGALGLSAILLVVRPKEEIKGE